MKILATNPNTRDNNVIRLFVLFLIFSVGTLAPAWAAMTEYPKVRLRSLDKITARTMTFDARVGTTIKFGSIYIKILSCQKPDLQERDDAASFLQIWEITPDDISKWIFSGWMFASSPALSAMDHPIYDVWVIDCLDDGSKKTDDKKEEKKKESNIGDVVTKATTKEQVSKKEQMTDKTDPKPPEPAVDAVPEDTPATDPAPTGQPE